MTTCGQEMPDISGSRQICVLPADHKTRVHRSAPPVHVWAPEFETGDEEACIECTHPWAAHSHVYGCEMGWQYDSNGVAVTDGCECLRAHVSLSATEG